jgi:hypothetical protein
VISDILQAISDFNEAAKSNKKNLFIPHTTKVALSVQRMLKTSGCDKGSLLLHEHKHLQFHCYHVTSALSKLILSAKISGGIWPPGDSISKMRYQAGQLLIAVRHFVSTAQDLGVELKYSFVEDEFDLRDAQISDVEFVCRLDQLFTSALELNQKIIMLLEDPLSIETIIQTTVDSSKEMISVVGQLLSLAEDIPVPASSNEENKSFSSFQSEKDAVYTLLSNLVTLIQCLIDEPHQRSVLQSLKERISSLDKCVRQMIITAKLILNERELLDQVYWQSKVDKLDHENTGSKLALLQRRAMSLTLLPELQSQSSIIVSDSQASLHSHNMQTVAELGRRMSAMGRSMSESAQLSINSSNRDEVSSVASLDRKKLGKLAKFFGEESTKPVVATNEVPHSYK